MDTNTANIPTQHLEEATIRFAGDSGDGMQLTGMQFTTASALHGNDLSTFPDFPAEIRAPQGTVAGVSGFQIHFGSKRIFNPGDTCDVLVAMNAAALKANINFLRKGGMIIANTAGFDRKNLVLAKIADQDNPLTNGSLEAYQVYQIDISQLTKNCLKESGLGTKEIERSKNMFVLGLLFWLYNRPTDGTIKQLQQKFALKPTILEANLSVFKAGYNYGETTEMFPVRFSLDPAKLSPGTYRGITGNQALAYGLIAAGQKANLPLFLGTYPITPASDILHELSKHKHFGVATFQAEDEIAGITAALGAAFGGALAVTTSSGPGIALKTEAMGLGVMMELPLIICNIQRGGPSTGLPTKTEQADLLQAYYGRNGEAPIPILAPQSASDCFYMAFEAARIAITHMTPVLLLSDAYLANGSEPWRFPKAADLPAINPNFVTPNENADYMPYARNAQLVRRWALPGTPGLEHRLGGLEKEDGTGNVSYDGANHEKMVKIRHQRVQNIAHTIPDQTVILGPDAGKLIVVGWGGTYGSLRAAVQELIDEGYNQLSYTHLRYLNPFPANLKALLAGFDHIWVPEINNGQLSKILRAELEVNCTAYNKMQGLPFSTAALKIAILNQLNAL